MIEYIVGHYAWFLGAIVLILLAVLGYYSDKTNFGQKKLDKKNKKEDVIEVESKEDVVKTPDLKPQVEESVEETKVLTEEEPIIEKVEEFTDETPVVEKNAKEQLVEITEVAQKPSIKEKTVEDKEVIKKKFGRILEGFVKKPINISIADEIEEIEEAEDSFNKISEQIDSLLPEKDVINIGLLEDLDELELGKTRKINFNLVPDLDDVDLPKIKKLVDEEQDIWKF